MRPLPPAVHVVTAVLLVNILVALLEGPGWLVGTLILVGPVLMIWMVWRVLNDRSMPIAELGHDEDWGYQDRQDLRPGGPHK